MGAHIEQTDGGFALVSILGVIIMSIGLSTIGVVVATTSGAISIFINWPKFKARVKEVIKRKK